MPCPLNQLSYDHPQICITTWRPWPRCEWQRQKLKWSQPSNEIKVPGKLQARQRLHQTAISSTEHSVTFQPPLAPHFGGVSKRLIQTAQRTLLLVLGSQKLTLWVFQTVVAEAEAILNSRPLTHVGCSISDEGPLTPNYFLHRRSHICSKSLVDNIQRFSTKDFKLTQTLLHH